MVSYKHLRIHIPDVHPYFITYPLIFHYLVSLHVNYPSTVCYSVDHYPLIIHCTSDVKTIAPGVPAAPHTEGQ